MLAKLDKMWQAILHKDNYTQLRQQLNDFMSLLVCKDEVLPDVFEVASRVVLVASASDLKLVREYDDVVLFMMNCMRRKREIERHALGDNLILWQVQHIDVCTHILCLVFSDKLYVQEAPVVFPREWYEDLVKPVKIMLMGVLQEIVYDNYTRFPTGYREKLDCLVRTRFAKITMSVRLCMSTRINRDRDYEETQNLLDVYLELLTHMCGDNGCSECVLADIGRCIRSLEEMAIENIEVYTTSSRLFFVNDVVFNANRKFLYQLYQYRKTSNIDHIKSAEMALPLIIHVFLRIQSGWHPTMSLTYGSMQSVSMDVLKWLFSIVEGNRASLEAEDLREHVMTQCMEKQNTGSVFDVIAQMTFDKYYTGYETGNDVLFLEFATFLDCFLRTHLPSSRIAIAQLLTTKALAVLMVGIYTNISAMETMPISTDIVGVSARLVLQIMLATPELKNTSMCLVITRTRNSDMLQLLEHDIISETHSARRERNLREIRRFLTGEMDITHQKIVEYPAADMEATSQPVVKEGFTLIAHSVTVINLRELVEKARTTLVHLSEVLQETRTSMAHAALTLASFRLRRALE